MPFHEATSKCHFPHDSQMGVPKLKLLLSQNFGHSYLFQINFFGNAKEIFYSPQKDLSNGVMHAPIKAHLTFTFKGFVVESIVFNLTPTLSFDHNSCKSGLNEQCEGILSIYTSKKFNGVIGGPI